MKKQKRRAKRYDTAAAAAKSAPETATEQTTRRDLLRKVRNGGIALAVLGGGGWFAVQDVQATIQEHDLTRIGNGVPTVVQIHDPNCSLCVALQKETRAAVKDFGDDEMQFLVANIRDTRGKKLATEHGVGHVTLLLFDGKGRRREIMRGSQDRVLLESTFRQFVAKHAR